MKFYVGTSGWQYGDWQKFYPEDLKSRDFLSFYAGTFNSAEINASFYRMTRKTTFTAWAEAVDKIDDFKFSVKLHKHFTRERKLELDSEDLEKLQEFLLNATGLGKMLGPILVQSPPSMQSNLKVLEKFLIAFFELAQNLNIQLKLAVEFRHPSWLNNQTYELLKKYQAAFVISDSARWPTKYIKTSDFAFVRLHGKPRMFYSLYSKQELLEIKSKILGLDAKDAFVYFNNTIAGHAAQNAREFKNL